ncbi:MAG: hypothetical protein QOI82_1588 [Actinomycetota bacterium]|jgi:thiol-disulfide isomerase/thioredoxin/uncharacterized membrane protein YphA (DoxX/SURF4 family)|nr:hypothetical protein [Actinomycetota bacterium]
MTVFALVCRLVLAAVFVVSAVAKLRDRPGARQAVQDFGLPRAAAGAIAAVLPFVELALAILLVVADPGATVGAVGAVLLLAAFTVTIVLNLARGKQVDCHCFGQLTGGAVGWRSVVRNVVLIAVAAVPLARAGTLSSLPAALDDYSGDQLALAGVLAVLAIAVLMLGFVVRELMQRYGAALLRLDALESYVGLAAPVPAPAFELTDLDGAVVSLDEVLATGKPALLAFIAPSCHLCDELIPDLERWQNDSDHPVPVLVLSTGSVPENRQKLGAAKVQVLLQNGREVETAYGVAGTPSIRLVGSDGILVGTGAAGLEGVRAMHDNVVRNLLEGHVHSGGGVHQIEPRPVGPGDVLPDADVAVALDGEERRPLSVLTDDEQVLLFWRFDCGYCAQIIDDVKALEHETNLLVVTGSTTESIRDTGLASRILREDGALSRVLRVPGTPAAVTVHRGIVTSNVAVGGPEVLALLERTRVPSATGS